jgi:hypothetical protein
MAPLTSFEKPAQPLTREDLYALCAGVELQCCCFAETPTTTLRRYTLVAHLKSVLRGLSLILHPPCPLNICCCKKQVCDLSSTGYASEPPVEQKNII